MSKILYTAFNGNNNSSKVLLDNINTNIEDKLYLRNSFNTSVKQLNTKIKSNKYDLIISFGQCPLEENNIKIETMGKSNNEILSTKYNWDNVKNNLESIGYNVSISDDAGTYLCNNIYYNGLKIIKENNLKCNMIFIHIPMLQNIKNIKALANLVGCDSFD